MHDSSSADNVSIIVRSHCKRKGTPTGADYSLTFAKKHCTHFLHFIQPFSNNLFQSREESKCILNGMGDCNNFRYI